VPPRGIGSRWGRRRVSGGRSNGDVVAGADAAAPSRRRGAASSLLGLGKQGRDESLRGGRRTRGRKAPADLAAAGEQDPSCGAEREGLVGQGERGSRREAT
jgi:hypothetical protein